LRQGRGGRVKVLVTGATGFVGSAVARMLLKRGHAVRALARPRGDRRNIAGLDIEIAEGDLADRATLERAARGCQALFHVAADYRLWARNPREIVEHNVQGTRNVLLAAAEAGVGRIVYTSSVAVLGKAKPGESADEDTPVTVKDMIGAYKTSKFLAEDEVRGLIAQLKLDCVIVNPSTPIGPRDIKPTPTGRMVVEAARGRMPAFVDTGLNVVHVEDVAEGHWLAFEKGKAGRRYVLGGENMTLREILTAIAGIVGRRPPRVSLPHDLILPFAYLAEFTARYVTHKEPFATVDGVNQARRKMFFKSDRAKAELNYKPRPAIEALKDAIAWFKANGYLQ
jgi:dihydroflavonol-4-reductase